MASPNNPDRSVSGGRSNKAHGGDAMMGNDGLESKKGEARQKADDLAHKAGETARDQIDRQKEQAVGRLNHVSGALRSTSDHLRDEDESSIAKYVDDAAAQVDRFVGYLDQRSAGDLLHDARQLARRDPALFLGGAALLGLVGARFVRSSNGNGHRQMTDRGSQHENMQLESSRAEGGDESHRI